MPLVVQASISSSTGWRAPRRRARATAARVRVARARGRPVGKVLKKDIRAGKLAAREQAQGD